MTKLFYILPLVLILCGCEISSVRKESDGHTYLWIPVTTGHYEHDPQCGKCQEMKK